MVQSIMSNLTTDSRHITALNGGRIERAETSIFTLPAGITGYADAQIDDYGGQGGTFRWRPGTTLSLRARFSHDAATLRGTAGFGFWNAPYGEPSHRRPALPRAVWFFFGSAPNDLPFAPDAPGRGWFAGTIDVRPSSVPALVPLAPAVLLLNQFRAAREHIWPAVRRQLGIHAAPIVADMTTWHEYRIEWRVDSVTFLVDGMSLLETPRSPCGPLGFVCWLDNQYLVLTPRGRFRAGTLHTNTEQWMEIADLHLEARDKTIDTLGLAP